MTSSFSVAGRTCVVTGAGSGIGRALAQRLARHGCPVALCDWDADSLQETVGLIDGPTLPKQLDVRDRNATMVFADEVKQWAPTALGMVVNNAGVTVSQLAATAAVEDDKWVFDVNFWGVVNGTRAYLPLLLGQGDGAIVNVSSIFGLVGWPAQSAYCASKHAVRGYTESLRHELHGTNVRAVTVHPGGIATNIVNNARFHQDDLGNTDRSDLEADFRRVARTSPDVAARTIHRGVERGDARILIGPDARMIAGLACLSPSGYYGLIRRLQPLVRGGR